MFFKTPSWLFFLTDVFPKGKSHRVEQRGTNIEEVAIQQAHQQKRNQGKADIEDRRFSLRPEQLYGLEAVEAVGQDACNAAACQKLDHRIMPASRQKCLKFVQRGPFIDLIGAGIEALTENGIFQEGTEALGIDDLPHSGIETSAAQLCEKPVQISLEDNKQDNQQQKRQGIEDQHLFSLGAIPQGGDQRQNIYNDRPAHSCPGTGQAGDNHHKKTQHTEKPGFLCLLGQADGKRHHHSYHAANVVGIAPTGGDQAGLDFAVDDDLLRYKDADDLCANCQTYAQTDPGKVVGIHPIPLHCAAEKPVANKDRCKLDQGKKQVMDSVFKVSAAECACQ